MIIGIPPENSIDDPPAGTAPEVLHDYMHHLTCLNISDVKMSSLTKSLFNKTPGQFI